MEIQDFLQQRKQTEREERVDRILGAARKMFLKMGYLKTTMRGISAASQLSTGAIYFYFKNKEEIYVRIVEEAFEILGGMLQEAEAGEGNGMKKMRAVMEAYFQFYTNFHDHYRLLDMVTVWRGMLTHEKIEKMRVAARSHLACVESCVKHYMAERGMVGADSWKLTYNLWAGVEGIFSIDKMGYLAGAPYSLSELIDEQLTLFERGLGAK